MSQALITSRDPRGLQFMNMCEAMYNKAGLNEVSAQCLNENGGKLTAGLKKLIEELSVPNCYANEEVASSHRYPEEYKGPRPIGEQIKALARILSLSPDHALRYAEKVFPTRTFPEDCEGPFAIANHNALARRFFSGVRDQEERLCAVSNLILARIGVSRKFYNFREGQLTPDRFRLNARTAYALEILEKQQKGDIFVVGGQFGKLHAGKSVNRAREIMVGPQFGAHTVAAGSMLLTHPQRLVSYDNLWFNVPGDEFDLDRNGSFVHAPYFHFLGGSVKFDTLRVGRPYEFCGSVSLFLPA